MTEEVKRTFRLHILRSTENIVSLLVFEGAMSVGGYVLGNNFYSNKVVGLKLNEDSVDKIDTDGAGGEEYDKIEIVLENLHPTHPFSGFPIEITGFSENKPIRSQFRISKSN